MIDPILIAAIATLGCAAVIGLKLLLPELRRRRDQSSHGLSDAKHRMVESTSRMVEKRSGRGLQTMLEKSGSQLRSG